MTASAGRLPARAGARLKQAGLRLALVEIATRGAVADALTDIPGSSAYLVGALTAADASRLTAFGYAPTASTSDPAAGLAGWVRDRLAADLGLATVPMITAAGRLAFRLALVGPAGVIQDSAGDSESREPMRAAAGPDLAVVLRAYRPRGGAGESRGRLVRRALELLIQAIDSSEAARAVC